jgi:hypothetical protein
MQYQSSPIKLNVQHEQENVLARGSERDAPMPISFVPRVTVTIAIRFPYRPVFIGSTP